MCMFDMWQKDNQGRARVKKATGFMTNAECIAERLRVKCKGLHRHITLINGRAKAAEVYPDKLCREIVLGLIEQMESDERVSRDNTGVIAAFDGDNKQAVEFWDDLSGKRLNPTMVKAARKEEMSEFRKHGVYIKVPVKQCWDETGKAPIGVRWVDINKGDEEDPDYRSRLVAQEVNMDKSCLLYTSPSPRD